MQSHLGEKKYFTEKVLCLKLQEYFVSHLEHPMLWLCPSATGELARNNPRCSRPNQHKLYPALDCASAVRTGLKQFRLVPRQVPCTARTLHQVARKFNHRWDINTTNERFLPSRPSAAHYCTQTWGNTFRMIILLREVRNPGGVSILRVLYRPHPFRNIS